jgi:uncharacterized linocin/CFP29 family protein
MEMETPAGVMSGAQFGEQCGGKTIGQMRPFIGDDGRTYFTEYRRNADGKLVANAKLVEAGMAVNVGSLRPYEWQFFDRALLNVYQRPHVAIADLINAGLTFDLDGYANTVLSYETLSDLNPATMSMDAETQGQGDAAQYDMKYLPLPIIHKDFSIGDRTLQMSRKLGTPLDTSNLEAVAIKINDYRENMLFNGCSGYTFGGGSIYGYIDWPLNVSQQFTSGTWMSCTPAQIITDMKAALLTLAQNRRYGPYGVYVPLQYEPYLSADYSILGQSLMTVRERIMRLSDQIQFVRSTPFIVNDSVVIVDLAIDTVRLVRGMPMTTIQWQERQMGRHNFKVVTIEVPQFRTDAASRSGVVVLYSAAQGPRLANPQWPLGAEIGSGSGTASGTGTGSGSGS